MDKNYIKTLNDLEQDFISLAVLIEPEKIRNFLRRPIISDLDKLDLLLKSLKNMSLQEVTKKGLKVIAMNRRLDILSEICESVEEHVALELNEIQIEIKLSHSISSKQIDEFQKSLETKIERKTRIKTKVDNSIICGYIVKYKELEFDNSVSGKLNNISHLIRETISQ